MGAARVNSTAAAECGLLGAPPSPETVRAHPVEGYHPAGMKRPPVSEDRAGRPGPNTVLFAEREGIILGRLGDALLPVRSAESERAGGEVKRTYVAGMLVAHLHLNTCHSRKAIARDSDLRPRTRASFISNRR